MTLRGCGRRVDSAAWCRSAAQRIISVGSGTGRGRLGQSRGCTSGRAGASTDPESLYLVQKLASGGAFDSSPAWVPQVFCAFDTPKKRIAVVAAT